MLGHMESFLKKKKNCQAVFHCGYLFYSHQQKMRCCLKQKKKKKGCCLSTFLSAFGINSVLDFIHFNMCGVISFDLQPPDDTC